MSKCVAGIFKCTGFNLFLQENHATTDERRVETQNEHVPRYCYIPLMVFAQLVSIVILCCRMEGASEIQTASKGSSVVSTKI